MGSGIVSKKLCLEELNKEPDEVIREKLIKIKGIGN
jgi:3-methyladenine DNA glycosylase/8-oxoguanine DNA glycosylase